MGERMTTKWWCFKEKGRWWVCPPDDRHRNAADGVKVFSTFEEARQHYVGPGAKATLATH